MVRTLFLATALVILLAAVPARVLAESGAKGTITIEPGGGIAKVEIKYSLGSLMGEPTVLTKYRYWTSPGYENAKLPVGTCIWLEVKNGMGGAFIVDNPVRPDKPGEWSYNTTGSPFWGRTLATGFQGCKANGWNEADTAKSFWREGFSVVGADITWPDK